MLGDLRKRLSGQDGSGAAEVLLVMPAVLIMLMLVVQVAVIFSNGIMVNHALAVAANEAAARGGVDRQVESVFKKELPSGISKQCDLNGTCLTVSVEGSEAVTTNPINPGDEETKSGDIIRVAFKYQQPAPMLVWAGVNPDKGTIPITRSMRVGSQSLQEK